MQVEIIRKFKDKNTLKWHEVGEKIKVSKERYDEIKNFCVIVNDETIKENKKNK